MPCTPGHVYHDIPVPLQPLCHALLVYSARPPMQPHRQAPVHLYRAAGAAGADAKPEKGKGKGKAAAPAKAAEPAIDDASYFDIRVGKIVEVCGPLCL